MKRIATLVAIGAAFCALSQPVSAIVKGKPIHAISIQGEPKYGPDFKNFDYVNPNAPKGGTLVLSNANDHTFDTFNPFPIKGTPARGFTLLYDSLTVGGDDEPSTNYCLICETMEVAPDNSSIDFKLRPQAKFNDGSQITPDDVVFSFNTLMKSGKPFYKVYWADIDHAEARGKDTVRFVFKTKDNPELASIISQLPVLSKAYWSKHDFTATSLDRPVSTGPYTVESFDIGRQVTYKRDPNYWAKDLPVVRGFYNFDHIRFEYYRDETVRFEAFKRGDFDLFNERTAKQWATAYDFPAVTQGKVAKLDVVAGVPMEAQGFVLNLRRAKFQDRRVREALNLAFDFDSLNRTLFYNLYTRVRSYFQRSELEPKGVPSKEELAFLEPLRGKIPDEVFTQEFQQPSTKDANDVRANLLKARNLLTAAGWEVKNGQLVNKAGEPLTFEVLLIQSSFDRVVLPWFQNLERLGIKATMRVIETSQFANRVNDFDYDVIVGFLANSLSPGNEQAEFWGSEAADRPGSLNAAGVKDPAVDALIAKVINAPDRPTLVAASKALDRVLVANQYYILHYGSLGEHYAYWTKLKHPDRFPLNGMPAPGEGAPGPGAISMWWADSTAAK